MAPPTRQAQRASISNLIQRISTQATAVESADWTEVVIQMKMSALEKHWHDFQAKQLEITSRTDLNEANLEAAEQVAMQAAALSTTVRERLKVLLGVRAPNRDRPVPKASEITLRKFNGDFTEWTAWRAQYVSKVHNADLQADEKLDLLLAALEDKAKDCAGDSEQRDANELQ